MKHKIRLILFLMALVFWAVSACAPMVRVDRPQSIPSDKSGQRTIGIIEFTGPGGDDFTGRLRNLVKSDPALILTTTGRAEWLVSGQVEREHQETEGVDLVKEKMKAGFSEKKTIRDPFVNRTFTVREPVMVTASKKSPYIHHHTMVQVTYTITDQADNIVFGPETIKVERDQKYGGVNEDYSYGPGIDKAPSEKTLQNELAEKMAEKLAARLSPIPHSYFLILDRGSGLTGEKAINDGVNLAVAGRWEEAVLVWNSVLDKNPEHPAALYNLGVYYERKGGPANLKTANEYYAQANKLSNKSLYRDALTRVVIALDKKQNPITNKDYSLFVRFRFIWAFTKKTVHT